ncbi:MAG TPA: SPW repeat protein [Pseudonocardiaceae bacterium]|nr:SPW repeat protein [Pseudonocardiaceae bacterium]
MGWAVPVIGVWTVIAPWVVDGHVATTATIWSNVVTGVVAVLLGLAAMAVGVRRSH